MDVIRPIQETVRGMVLVADDEPAIQTIVAQVLSELDLVPVLVITAQGISEVLCVQPKRLCVSRTIQPLTLDAC